MKKSIIKVIYYVSLLIFLFSCNKADQKYDVYFFTDIENSPEPLSLFVEGKYIGKLPYLNTDVSPINDTIIKSALHLVLERGKYNIEAKDDLGSVKYSGKSKFKPGSLSGTSSVGRQTSSASNNVVAIKLSY